ncbi:hypothetical protein [Alkalimonas amylolytica]|uniref:Uncharacterized protein n=1 Tax=Alkalimonas amylolytica TaxID=152573 RepID=A0A1H4G671_ALKAM|nr:hypothetical protein [Alkalimonas amylolytica]SEB05116.1 hypothetical protein SAMN04488051_1233 [Alkalimonas amylolytica]
MDKTVSVWFEVIGFIVIMSLIISYPLVAWFVTRPLQRLLRSNQQDMISDMVVWPFKSFWYALAILFPFARWRLERDKGGLWLAKGNNHHFIEGMDKVRQLSSASQWWLSLWLMCAMSCSLLLVLLSWVLGYYF